MSESLQMLNVRKAAKVGSPRASFGCSIRWLIGTVPTALVLAALGGLAFWGHHSGWTMPKFSVLTGHAAAGKDDWCAAHAVPESLCVECNADLLPMVKKYGWCKKHGVPNCPLEHPDVAQVNTVARATPADVERAERALRLLPRPKNNDKCKLYLRRIQFASQEAFDRAGIEPWPVGREEIV